MKLLIVLKLLMESAIIALLSITGCWLLIDYLFNASKPEKSIILCGKCNKEYFNICTCNDVTIDDAFGVPCDKSNSNGVFTQAFDSVKGSR